MKTKFLDILPGGLSFHWGIQISFQGFFHSIGGFRYPSRGFIIPLEGFRYPSWGFIIPLGDSDILPGGL